VRSSQRSSAAGAALAIGNLVGVSALLALLAASCATYPQRTAGALGDFQGGRFDSALAGYADPEAVGSEFLSGAEAGTVAMTAGDWEGSLFHLHRAAAASRDIERRALASPEELGEGLASWAINDTARAYEGEGFERVYVHCGLALAYLAQGSLDDVYVEARRANRLLEAEEELYEKEYRAGGWGHLISGLAYELLGQLDDAYIDYRRMAEKEVGTALAGPALVRLAKHLRLEDDLRRWEDRFGPAAQTPEGAASIVVLGGVGLGPYKVEARIPIPTHDGIIPISASRFAARTQPVSGLRLRALEAGAVVETAVVENVARVAAENLEDRLAWSVAKSVARGLLKRELTKQLDDQFGWEGRLAGDIFAVVSERADLRCWLTLPDTWQAGRLFVPPGVHTLTLEAVGGEEIPVGTFELDPGETMLIFARSLGTRVYAHAIGGGLPEEAAASAVGGRS